MDALVASERLTGYCALAIQLPAPIAAAGVPDSDSSGTVGSLAHAPTTPVRSTAICRCIGPRGESLVLVIEAANCGEGVKPISRGLRLRCWRGVGACTARQRPRSASSERAT